MVFPFLLRICLGLSALNSVAQVNKLPQAGLGFSVFRYLWIGRFEAFSALSKLNLSWLCLKAFQGTGRMLPFITKGFLSPLLLISFIPIFLIHQHRHTCSLPWCFGSLSTYDSEKNQLLLTRYVLWNYIAFSLSASSASFSLSSIQQPWNPHNGI